jgi:very-short-patch-repair endonuclease
MTGSLVMSILKAFPNGRTTGQLMADLDATFRSARRRAAVAELRALVAGGEIVLDRDRRWRSVRDVARARPDHAGEVPGARQSGWEGAQLRAVPARFSAEPATVAPEPAGDAPVPPGADKLLRYYRAALRSDPRGAVEQVTDAHGVQWQLLCGRGVWWPEDGRAARIAIRLDDLPADLRRALARRSDDEKSLALGWPIDMRRKMGVPVALPAGLLTAEWAYGEGRLVLRIATDGMAVNPAWTKAAASSLGWEPGALAGALGGTDGAPLSLPLFRERLREAAAGAGDPDLPGTRLRETVDPAREGLIDALALFLPTEASFTAGAVRDLDAIASREEERVAGTALGALLGLEAARCGTGSKAVLNPGRLNAEQIEAVSNAQAHRLSVVTGPPGTGKSQTIVAMVATAVAKGETVLVASRNHQALDAVEQRIGALAEDSAPPVRTLDPATERDTGFAAVLEALATVVAPVVQKPEDALAAAWGLAESRRKALEALAARRRLHAAIADHLERLRHLENVDVAPSREAAAKRGPLRRLLDRLLRRPIRDEATSDTLGGPLPPGSDRTALARALATDRRRLEALAAPETDPVETGEQIAQATATALPRLLGHLAGLSDEARRDLAGTVRDRQLYERGAIDRPTAERCLAARPVWLASVLGAPRRIPLMPALFDLLIVDEASQCDIAAALPLFARARRAAVVGDNHQLAFIPGLGAAQDRNLMASQGLPSSGMGRWSQGLNSLFDLAHGTPGVPSVMLRDQFRSAPGITGYINEAFYGGRLRVAADPERLRAVPGRSPGLHWTDVRGTARPGPAGGTSNPAEAEAVVAELVSILARGFEGSIGVIAPFNAQVGELQRRIHAVIDPADRERVELKIATVDRFQGEERDLVLFSPTVSAASPTTARSFLQRDWRRINVAVSRARAVLHVIGDLDFARRGGIGPLRRLAAHATEPRETRGETDFDSPWERVLYHGMRRRGLEPIPQYAVAGRRLDFALRRADEGWLDVEVDGRRFHTDADGLRKLDDLWRDHQLRALGWRVIRFWVDELDRDLEGCLDGIEAALR